MKKRGMIIGVGVLMILVTTFFVWPSSSADGSIIWAEVEQGDFVVTVTTSGELEAKNSIEIHGPSGIRAARIWRIAISKMIPEGTPVNKGDFIASLDKSEVGDKVGEASNRFELEKSEYMQKKLDTTLTLREARDKLINLEFAVEEKKLVLEQSAFEPPATIKKAEIDLQKAERDLRQAIEGYNIKQEKATAEVRERYLRMQKEKKNLEFFKDLVEQLNIMAPANGILFYKKEWNGEKVKQGSQISAYDLVVATLPDLDTLISKTYVNEVDISKIVAGQRVKVTFDAFSDKVFEGEVVSVANAGEQKPNSDAKVFEVGVLLKGNDPELKPGMTTGNVITTNASEGVLFIPLESLHNLGDSVTYVFRKSGSGYVSQEVEIGLINANEAVVKAGLKAGDRVMLSKPKNLEDIPEISRLL